MAERMLFAIDDKALEAAGIAYGKAGGHEDASPEERRRLAEALSAYLAVLPAPDEGQVERVAQMLKRSPGPVQATQEQIDLWARLLAGSIVASIASSPPSSPEGLTEDEIRAVLIEKGVTCSSRLPIYKRQVQAFHDGIVEALLAAQEDDSSE